VYSELGIFYKYPVNFKNVHCTRSSLIQSLAEYGSHTIEPYLRIGRINAQYSILTVLFLV